MRCLSLSRAYNAASRPLKRTRDLHIWLRAESKPHEQRTLLLPEHVQALRANGHEVTVEESVQRCVSIDNYASIEGVKIAPEGSWPKAPADAIIGGLKELPETNDPIRHRHIFFAHVYKGQTAAAQVLARFKAGGGTLWDLEFLLENGRRVAAFGSAAGQAGMAVGLLVWAHQRNSKGKEFPPLFKTWSSFDSLAKTVSEELGSRRPSVLIVGHKGRVGSGADNFASRFNLPVTRWDSSDTRGKSGPFPEILEHDIFVNSILLSPTAPPLVFVNKEMMQQSRIRNLSVIADVSCDPNNPRNPIPIYDSITTLKKPVRTVKIDDEYGVDVMAIDHLPSLVPEESSREFARDLLPHLLKFPSTSVWQDAEKLFHAKIDEVLGGK